MTIKNLIIPSVLALTLAACSPKETTAPKGDMAKAEMAVKTPVLGSFGIDMASMNTAVKPGDNFFQYVNGTWLDNTEIPSDKSNYGSFNILADLSDDRVKAIIEAASAKMFASEMCNRVADRCVQIHGGAGYLAEYDAERFYRDSRIYTIYEGTTQILQLVIAKNMLREFEAGVPS